MRLSCPRMTAAGNRSIINSVAPDTFQDRNGVRFATVHLASSFQALLPKIVAFSWHSHGEYLANCSV